MERMRIGIIRGGPTPAYDLSLKTGAALLNALPPERYEPRDIFIDRQGNWHVRGRPVGSARALSQLDGALIAVHGAYGEGGNLQRTLHSFGIPYVGADPFGAAFSLSKKLSKERLLEKKILTPVYTVVTRDILQDPHAIVVMFREFPQPSIIKPLSGGSSIGVMVANNYEQFHQGMVAALSLANEVLVEEYIRGREATVGTLEGFRDEEVYALPPVEVAIDRGLGHFDYQRKLTPTEPHKAPGTFTHDEKQELMRIAKAAHRELNLRDIGRHDFVVAKRGIVYIESNSVPEIYPESTFEVGLSAVGAKLSHTLDHLLARALSRPRHG